MSQSSVRRPDAWEAALTEEQRWQVYERLKRFAWQNVQPWLVEEFLIEPPGKTALYQFKRHMAGLESAHRIEEALSNRENLRREMEKLGDMDPELQHAWLQLAHEATLRDDPKAGERYLKMARALRADATKRLELQLKTEAEKRSREQLRLDTERFEVTVCEKFLAWFKDDKAREIAESSASNAEKIAALRQAYYSDVDEMERSGKVQLPQ